MYIPSSSNVPSLRHLCDSTELKYGGAYAVTEMDTVFSADTRPLESVTVAVKVIVPEVFKNPVVSVEAVPL